MKRSLAWAFAIAWLLLGVIGLLTHADVIEGEPGYSAIMLPAAYLSPREPNWAFDSAHGPPFLTVPGVIAFYLVPALLAAAALFTTRGTTTEPKAKQRPAAAS